MENLETLDRRRLDPSEVGNPYPWEKPVLLTIPGSALIAGDLTWAWAVTSMLVVVMAATLGFRLRRSKVLIWPWSAAPPELQSARSSQLTITSTIFTFIMIFTTIALLLGVPWMFTVNGILLTVASISSWAGGGKA